MMLVGTERDLVVQLISEHLSQNEPSRPYLKALIPPWVKPPELGDAYRRGLDELSWSNPRAAAVVLLAFLEQQAPGPQPLLLPKFLRSLGDVRLERVVGRLEAELAPSPDALVVEPDDPIETLLVFGKQPFLNRSELRPALQEFLFKLDGPCVLLVNGPKRSGKTYTFELIEHVRRRRQDFSTVWADFGGELLPPESVASRLVARMGVSTKDMPKPGLETMSNYVGKLTDWVVEQALATGKRWCFLLDGIRDDTLVNDTRNFIHQLARTIERGAPNDYLRLVLLEYEEPLSHLQPSSIARDDLKSPDHIGQVDVEDYFEWLMAKSGLEVDWDMVKLHAQAVIEQCPTGDPERLRALYDAVEVDTPTFLPAGWSG
jgi:hypothetical protein